MEIYGCFYEGNFEKNKRKGMGRMLYSTKEVYEGEWIEDLQSTFPFPFPRPHFVTLPLPHYSHLTFTLTPPHLSHPKHPTTDGHGTMTYPSGDKYVGGWKEGKRSSKGKL